MWVVMLLSLLKANAVLDKCKHLMLIEYSINEQTKDKGIVYVDILFHHRGKTYVVIHQRYLERNKRREERKYCKEVSGSQVIKSIVSGNIISLPA